MHKYDLNLRSGSYLDMDTKLHEKYLRSALPAEYALLVKLNVELKAEIAKLRRQYAFKFINIRMAIIT